MVSRHGIGLPSSRLAIGELELNEVDRVEREVDDDFGQRTASAVLPELVRDLNGRSDR
jgi:hypothetical protein